ALAHLFADTTLDALFDRVAVSQYTRELTFSTLIQLMTKVVFTTQPSVNAAYRHAKGIPVSLTAVYDKLGAVEPGVSAALVAETAAATQGLLTQLLPTPAEAIAGLHLRTLDGNFLAGTDHRLDCLRGSGAAALPGMSLVVRDGRHGLLTQIIPCE